MKTKIPLVLILILSLAALGGCKKEDPINVPVRKSAVQRPFYFIAEVDSASSEMNMQWKQEDVLFSFSNNTIFSGNNRCVSPGTKIVTGQGGFDSPEIRFMYYCYNPAEETSESHFRKIFTQPQHSFYSYYDSNGNENFSTGGVVLSLTDSAGVSWSTKWGPQEGSTFSIVDSEEAMGEKGETRQNVHAKFECNLYDNKGNSRKLKNGSLFFPYEKLFN